MPVAKLTLEIEIAHAQSLKDRRQVVRSMKDTLRRGFNVSVAEMDGALAWNRATLEVVAVSASTQYLAGQLAQVERAATRIATRTGAEISDAFAELLGDGQGESLDRVSGDPGLTSGSISPEFTYDPAADDGKDLAP